MRIKTEEKRQKLLGVALEVFLEMGYQRASMGEISARLGGSKATLYNYYDSKELLFADVIRRCIHPLLIPAFSELDHGFDDVRSTLIKFGKCLMQILCMPVFIAARRMIVAESGHTDIGEMYYNEGPQKGHAIVVAYIQGAMAAGKLMQTDPHIACRHLIALLQAETMERTTYCLPGDTSQTFIDDSVMRAIDVFMRAYGVTD